MYPARAWSIQKPYRAAVGALLAFGLLVAVPAAAAHMSSNGRNAYVDEASAINQEPRDRQAPELNADSGANPEPQQAQPNNAPARPSRIHESRDDRVIDTGNSPRREVISDSIRDKLVLAGPGIATQPEELATMNTRVPGLSDATLARFKKRMCRKDI